MSKASNNSAYVMKEHSIAKVKFYSRYLSIYLNVIKRSPINKIHLFDFFAGEGKDVNGNISSSIAALECIKDHYFSNNQETLPIDVLLNDSGMSIIDIGQTKIQRVKGIASNIFIPKSVNITYSALPFEEILKKTIPKLNSLKDSERAFCFIDPWGYKEIKPQDIKQILYNGKTEVLLFLPICFIHRFAKKALRDEEYQAGKHIEAFIKELHGNAIPDISNQVKFITGIKNRFKEYLQMKYIDEVFIEKEKGQFFALFFFSNSKKGFHKMLEAKWNLDEKEGKGFTVSNTSVTNDLFTTSSVDIDHEDYTYKVEMELKTKKELTNHQLFDYGLENNHLPTHTKKVLDQLKKKGLISLVSLDSKPALSYYLDNSERNVMIKYKV